MSTSNSTSSKAPLWRALITLAVLIGSAALAFSFDPKLGLDLKGGTQFVLETRDTERVKATAETTDRALEVLRGRIDALGVAEPTIARSGEKRIIIELPGVQDPDKARETIGQTAQLQFREVIAPALEIPQGPDAPLVLPDESGELLELGPTLVDGNGVADANPGQPENQPIWVVNVEFTGEGVDGWQELVANACSNVEGGQRIAIVLDQTVISSPQVQPDLCAGAGSRTQITGNFTAESAKDLSVLIKGGALPVDVEFVEQRTIGPTLGASAIDASINAALIGLALTGAFIIFIYRVAGLMAAIALSTYALISYALLVWLGATLTLPGLAGFVLAIGLAIDANVLVFERAREEYRESPKAGIGAALNTGFNKAWSAILDSNVTTIIAAALLFAFAAGPVKGFGVTLTIGTAASMISALIVARTLTEVFMSRGPIAKRPALSGIAAAGRVRTWLENSNIDLMKRAGTWVMVTAAVAVISLGGIFIRGMNFGVEFTGGRILEFSSTTAITVDDARAAVSDAGFPGAVVQESSGDGRDNITIRTESLSEEEVAIVEEAIAEVGEGVELVRDEMVGPSIGEELRTKALIAFFIAIGAQMLYLAWRFRWTYALSAQVSMFSVVLTVIGFFAWTGRTFDGVFLASVLSIIGLAVNDTIVVFDRIREHASELRNRPLRETINEAILMTVPRTVNTGLGAMFILGALAFLGGDSLSNFSIALVLGLAIGILSTIFTASSLAVLLEERWPFDPVKSEEKKKSIDPYANIRGGDKNSGAVV